MPTFRFDEFHQHYFDILNFLRNLTGKKCWEFDYSLKVKCLKHIWRNTRKQLKLMEALTIKEEKKKKNSN